MDTTGAEEQNDGGVNFETAFAHVGDMTEAMEQRMEVIQREVAVADQQAEREEETRQIREEGWASRPIPRLRNYGNLAAFDRQQIGQKIDEIYPESESMETTNIATQNGRTIGCCCITGCAFPMMELTHKCTTCNRFVHMICAEPYADLADDDRYCDNCAKKR